MDSIRFDSLTRRLATRPTRRAVLGGIVGGFLRFVGAERADARGCSAPGRICRENANCCSGLCERDRTRRRRCQCQSADDCPTPRDPCQFPNCTDGVCGTTPVDCSGLDGACTQGVCVGGNCQARPANEGQACDDGDVCTQTDTCQSGSCVGSNPLVCTTDNPCLTSSCDPTQGCITTPQTSGTPCDADGDPCTEGDACDGTGTCVAGQPVSCPIGATCVNGTCQENDATTCDAGEDFCVGAGVAGFCGPGNCFCVPGTDGTTKCIATVIPPGGGGVCGQCQSDADCPPQDWPGNTVCVSRTQICEDCAEQGGSGVCGTPCTT